MSSLTLLTAALVLAAAGCALPPSELATADTALPGRSTVTLCVINPNPDALVVRRMTVDLGRPGSPLAAGVSEAAIVVPALSSTRVPVPVHAAARNGWTAHWQDVAYRVAGSVALEGAFGLNIPYRRVGHLGVLAAPDGAASPCSGSDIPVPL